VAALWLLKRQTGVILAYLTTVDSDVTRHAFVAPPEKPADEPRHVWCDLW